MIRYERFQSRTGDVYYFNEDGTFVNIATSILNNGGDLSTRLRIRRARGVKIPRRRARVMNKARDVRNFIIADLRPATPPSDNA